MKSLKEVRRNINCVIFFGVILLVGVKLVGAGSTQSARHQQNEFPGEVRLILPKMIYAVQGVEMNVYFDNIVLVINPDNYSFDVTCDKGIQQAERWTYNPKADEVGDYPFVIEVRDETNTIIARAKSTVRVVPANAGRRARIRLLAIGDSLTAAQNVHPNSVYTQHLLDLCNKGAGNPRLKLVGSCGPAGKPGENRHEGYGGWTAKRFITYLTDTARTGVWGRRGTPFGYKDDKGKLKLDFTRYCKEYSNGKGPDFVTIFLGCNEVFHATDENIEEEIDTMFTYYDTLLHMIHNVRKDTKIGVLLLVPPAATQDAFGAKNACRQTRWQYKRNQHRLVERMIERYDGRESGNIYLVPANVNLDCVNNYPQGNYARNSRTEEKVIRQRDSVHPDTEGYRQIGDTIYCWIKAQLAETSN